MFDKPPARIIYSYKRYQPLFDQLARDHDVVFVQGDGFELDRNVSTLLVVDDQMDCLTDKIRNIFCVDSHHMNCSVILLTQNLFSPSPSFRTISLNSQYMILFKSPRGGSQIHHLARQLYVGDKAKRVIDAYYRATAEPYSYLLIDMKPDTPDKLRFRTKIFHDEGTTFEGARLTECYKV